MKSFDQWFRDSAAGLQKKAVFDAYQLNIDPDLLDHNLGGKEISEEDFATIDWVYPCRRCKDDSPIYCDPEEFNYDMHYCGKDQYCIP